MNDADICSSFKERSTVNAHTEYERVQSNKTVQSYPVSEKESGDGKELMTVCTDGFSTNNQPHIDEFSASKEEKLTSDQESTVSTATDSAKDQDKEFSIATSAIDDLTHVDQDVLSNKQDHDHNVNSYLTIVQHTDPTEDSGSAYLDARQDQGEQLYIDIKYNQADVDCKFSGNQHCFVGDSQAEFNLDTGHMEFEAAVNKTKLNEYLEHRCVHFQPQYQIENELPL